MSYEKLIEGKDYTVEDGLFVFSKDYLARRGYCCRSGCRNCPYGYTRPMLGDTLRIVSLVPSWTETLLWAGLNVVGRTRYCIHPRAMVAAIRSLGGTKQIDLQALAGLAPSHVLLDREENTEQIAMEVGDLGLITHIKRIEDLAPTLRMMGKEFKSSALVELAARWERVATASPLKLSLQLLPGIRDWIVRPSAEPETVLYVIWRKPLMLASASTFIGSVLGKLCGAEKLLSFEKPYPEVSLSSFDPTTTALLFSSEPFPFERYTEEIAQLGFPAALVDGELFSWFGIRSLQFLEKALQLE